MKKLFFIFLLIFSNHVQAKETAWTYYFFIAGDFYYSGPTEIGTSKKLELKDQARATYEHVLQLARQDKTNNYAIFYDPKGRGGFFGTGSEVEFKYYSKGVWSNGSDWEYEVNQTSTDVIKKWIDLSIEAFGAKQIKENKKMLFFYGEHIPNFAGSSYDLNKPKGEQDEMSIETLRLALQHFVYETGSLFDLTILQVCYMNNLDFLFKLRHITQTLFVPNEAVLNSAMKLKNVLMSKNQDNQAIASLIKTNNPHIFDKYPFTFYDEKTFQDLQNMILEMRNLERALPQQMKYDIQELLSNAQEHQKNEWEMFSEKVTYLPIPEEIVISLKDYLGFIKQYDVESVRFQKLYEILKNNRDWLNTKKVLPAPVVP